MVERSSNIHAIRLRGPWACQPLEWLRADGGHIYHDVDRPVPAAGMLTVPGDWSSVVGPEFRGRARFVRRFGRPTGLRAADRVFLVVEEVLVRGVVWLHGERIGEIERAERPWRLDITHCLRPGNELWIDVEWVDCGRDDSRSETGIPGIRGGWVGEVRLEIESSQVGDSRLTAGGG